MLSEDPFPFLFWKVKFDETIKDISIFNDLKASQGDDITKKKICKTMTEIITKDFIKMTENSK